MYTIQFLSGNQRETPARWKARVAKRDKILAALRDRFAKDGIFNATLLPTLTGKLAPCIDIKPVRLAKAKPYCGQHPGECLLSDRPKPKATYLEWDDWIKFNATVNSVLNRFRVDANVWSNPPDVRGKFWIRKGTKARKRFDFDEQMNSYGQVVRIWNSGDESQFQ